eukprot:6750382-Lingulodinium_polyedra.AAC.1
MVSADCRVVGTTVSGYAGGCATAHAIQRNMKVSSILRHSCRLLGQYSSVRVRGLPRHARDRLFAYA